MFMTVEDENGRVVTIWHSDNFTPDHYLQRAGGIMSGVLKIHNKLFVSELPGFQDANPSISLAIGDNDTGFHSEGDGQIAFYSNGVRRYNLTGLWGSHNFDPNGKLNTTGGTINGNLTVTGAFSTGSISCTNNISIGGNMTITGTINGSNNITGFSDRRLKYNIADVNVSDIVEKLSKVQVKTFNMFSNDGDIDFGVIAQDMNDIIPDLVRNDEDEDLVASFGFSPMRVKYISMIPLLLVYIQKLEQDIKKLQKGES